MKANVVQDCGWGRVIFGQTFKDPETLTQEILKEKPNQRDVAIYVEQPHVVLSYAPQQLFLDPSDTLRLRLDEYTDEMPVPFGMVVRRIESQSEAEAINDIYTRRGMVDAEPGFAWRHRNDDSVVLLVAVDTVDGDVLGAVLGLDHMSIFDDPERGSSLWSLAVDPLSSRPGIGQALVHGLAAHFKHRGNRYMDLSVIHDNMEAKRLYEKIGFRPEALFTVKSKNAINEPLFIGPDPTEKLNPYARIIVDEARTRGIDVELVDTEEGYFRLTSGGKSVVCRESLTELTSAIAMSRCQDKFVTHRWLRGAGLKTPSYQLAGDASADREFLATHGAIVVKPVIGEQGKGITIGIRDDDAMERAIKVAREFSERVLLESFHAGQDLRVVVIKGHVVAAAVRRPAQIIGDGKHDAETLIAKQSRRREAATDGESTIPTDDETLRCLTEAGYGLGDVIEEGVVVQVRKTANLHTGGTIHDVTSILHPQLVTAARTAALRLDIPVVGLDFIVPEPSNTEYVIIEANERPGLANHEPQPTAERFVDLLFPLTAGRRPRRVAGDR